MRSIRRSKGCPASGGPLSHDVFFLMSALPTSGHMKTADLLAAAISLPIKERVRVIDSLVKSLNPPETDIDEEWALVARGTSRGRCGSCTGRRSIPRYLGSILRVKYSLRPEAEAEFVQAIDCDEERGAYVVMRRTRKAGARVRTFHATSL